MKLGSNRIQKFSFHQPIVIDQDAAIIWGALQVGLSRELSSRARRSVRPNSRLEGDTQK